MMKRLIPVLTLCGLSLASTTQAAVDSKLPDYQARTGVAGNLSSVGSDTLANLMTFWAEAFKKAHPGVNVQIQAQGSSTAPTALTQGTANFGPMSRSMKDNEVRDFEKKYGYKPLAIPVAIDALAVYVHKDNPVKFLSMPVVDAIFSSTRKCGFEKDITNWGQAGLSGDWARRNIQLFGRNSVSGTYGYFKEHALCKGDFKNTVNEQPGSAGVVQSISNSLNGIGYSGIGYKTSGVRLVPIKNPDTGAIVEATEKNALNKSYPLSRFLYVYVNKAPNKALAPLEAEFIRLMLSRQGQEMVEKDGFIPLPASEVRKALSKAGL